MDDLFLLSEEQMARISCYFPLSNGVQRVDDRRVMSGIIYVIKYSLGWKDTPKGYGPHKTLYNCFIRWSQLGVFDRIFSTLAAQSAKPEYIMIDATHLKAHGTCCKPFKKGALSRCIGRTKGGLNSKLRLLCNERGKPLCMLLSEGQMSDYKGAALLLPVVPKAKVLIADCGYDADWFRKAVIFKNIEPCIPPRKRRKEKIIFDKQIYAKRHRVENVFAKLKDWRRIATRYDRCAHTFSPPICIAATVICYLN